MRFLKPRHSKFLCALLFCIATSMVLTASGQTMTLRIATYNIEDDITNSIFHTNATTPLPGLIIPYAGGSVTNGGVLEGIGEEILSNGVARPIDIIALQETTSNAKTVQPIVDGLNAFYSQSNALNSNMYAMSTYQGTESGNSPTVGNGPNAIVYNTMTVQLIASVPVDPIGGTSKLGSSSGEYREVMRYEFAPAGQTPTASTEFYIYVSHYKSGTTAADLTDRAGEAYIIRTNQSLALPANARIIYVGDYNVTTSSESSYQTIVTAAPTNGVTGGQGVDVMNVSGASGIDWGASSLLSQKTESATSLRYRDDFQCMTTNIYYGQAGGLAYVQGTYHVFGNNGTTSYQSSVNNGANTSLNGKLVANAPISASQLYLDLTGGSDHLPVVADYTIPVNPPTAIFSGAPLSGAAPLTVTFTDASTGIWTNLYFNFGDGVTTNFYTNNTVTHTYTSGGPFIVTEIAYGPGGIAYNSKPAYISLISGYQAWQLQYFGCTNCPQALTNADADGTGQNNLFKYVAGLDPTNPASVFSFGISNGLATNQVKLVYSPNVTNRTYTAYYSGTLTNHTWTPIITSPLTRSTNGSTVTITNAVTGTNQRYYYMQISGPSL